MNEESPALYPRLMGASWSALARPVARLHATSAGATGWFRVRRGVGWLARALGRMMRLPEAGERVAVELVVERGGDGEQWVRRFGAHPLPTAQWGRDGLLVEGMGPVQCWFRLRNEEGALVFEQVRATLGGRRWGVRLPRWVAPQITGRASDRQGAVQVVVQIGVPWVGMLVAYDGAVTPTETT